MLTSSIRKWFHRDDSPTRPIRKTVRKSPFRPAVEMLEDRAVPAGFGFADFSDPAGLNLIGSASITTDNQLRLTPAVGGQAGAAWFASEKQVVNSAFEAGFEFEMTGDGLTGMADGIVFIIQNTSPTYVGIGAGLLGYDGLANSIAVEFDIIQNSEYGDTSGSQISVHTNGTGPNGASESLSLGSYNTSVLRDEAVHSVKIAYIPGSLSIYLDNMTTPKLTVSVNLESTLNLDADKAWVGFTAGTGAGYANQDILSWYFAGVNETALKVGDASIVEGNSGTSNLVFTINRTGDTSGMTTVYWGSENLTATTADNDYTAATGPVTFNPGQTQAQVAVSVLGDTAIEPHETFAVRLSQATGAIIADGNAVGTILTEEVAISIGDDTVVEGDPTTREFGALVSAGLDDPYAMLLGPDGNLYVSNLNTGSVARFNAVTGSPLPAPGKSGAEFVSPGAGGLQWARDIAFGPDGKLYVVSEGSDAILRYDAVTGEPAGIANEPGNAEFIASGSGGLDAPRGITFHGAHVYVTSVGTETPSIGKDAVMRFDAVTGAPAGLAGEPDDAVFIVSGSGGLDNPSRIVFGPDDKIYVSSTASTVNSATSNSILRYHPITGAPDGVSGQSGNAVFVTPGSGGLDGPIAIVFRPDNYVYVTSWRNNLVLRYHTSNGAFADTVISQGTVGLMDLIFESTGNFLVTNRTNDQILRFGPASQAVFTVSLSSASAVPVTVEFETADGTTIADSDYEATSGTLTFAPGQTTRTIFVQTLADADVDPDETFAVNLFNPSAGATILDAQGVGTIIEARQLFRANSTTTGIQITSGIHDVASDAAGNSVVVWTGNGLGDADGVFFQRYDPSGTPLGSETRVNIVTNASQQNPVVGRASSNGKFVIAWNTDPHSVLARVYNANGTPVTGEITIATGTWSIPGTRYSVESIAVDADGDFVVLYRQISKKVFSDTHYWQVQRYNAAGQPQGTSIRVASSIPPGAQGRVASDANGNFVVAWTQAGIQAQRYTSAGKKVGSQILVSATGAEANVARDADGDFVVTWYDKAQIFNKDGTKRGDPITFTEARADAIAMQANGDFVLSWTQSSPTTSTDAYAQRFDLNGVEKEAAHRVNVTAAGHQENTGVAVASNGNYVVVWSTPVFKVGPDPFTPVDSDVWGRLFTVPSPLMAASVPMAGIPSSEILRDDQLQPVLAEAIARWMATDLTAEQMAMLASVNVQIGNLGGATLGLASGNTIWLDDNAAGWGWFVDPTPWDDSEFYQSGDQGEQDRMDLLTVLEHELGHLLGFDHEEGGVMGETLSAGTRESSMGQFSFFDESAIADWFVANEKSPLQRKSF